MIVIPKDPFDAFHRRPAEKASSDPRFTVRQALESDFEGIYRCVDLAFGKTRPRAAYDWMYLKNPYGRALAWIVEENATGEIVKTGAKYPWPIWRDNQAVPGAVSGDSATVPRWQRSGLSSIRRDVRYSHESHGKVCSISGPNEGSRTVSNKAGQADQILGCLRGGLFLLDARILLQDQAPQVPNVVRSIAGISANALHSLWPKPVLRTSQGTDYRLDNVSSFSSDIDDITLKTMAFKGYWCPHNAEFLNWRYLEHPLETYQGFVLSKKDTPLAYSVLRMGGAQVTLSEFAAPQDDPSVAGELLRRSIEVARQAGAGYLNFFGPPAWPHWDLFKNAGMLPYKTNNWFEASYPDDAEGALDFNNWQVTPGDRDYH
ncbi:MAG: GNAT family N-acetyltransferase [Pseudomonadaceae bacterium]|nr:GNAT family N-acetyltransferase [Pseudomonadaceae bacterium]